MKAARAEIERLRYWQGQTLRSRDLNDQLGHDASLRWWHNRAIHDAYGLVTGALARLVGGEVEVTPGLAYDCFGRELVLAEARRLALPPAKPAGQEWCLVLRAVSAAAARPAVELVWVEQELVPDPRIGVRLALGRFTREGFELDATLRQRATQAVARPRLGSGATVHGRTDWRPWGLARQRLPFAGIEVRIDTAAAGFDRVPCYFAALRGDLFARLERGFFFTTFQRIVQATPTSFVFSLWLPLTARTTAFAARVTFSAATAQQPVGIVELARRELSVCWLGIEGQRRVLEKR